jgi:hypothetical protein
MRVVDALWLCGYLEALVVGLSGFLGVDAESVGLDEVELVLGEALLEEGLYLVDR